jgi:hypothetical protein
MLVDTTITSIATTASAAAHTVEAIAVTNYVADPNTAVGASAGTSVGAGVSAGSVPMPVPVLVQVLVPVHVLVSVAEPAAAAAGGAIEAHRRTPLLKVELEQRELLQSGKCTGQHFGDEVVVQPQRLCLWQSHKHVGWRGSDALKWSQIECTSADTTRGTAVRH